MLGALKSVMSAKRDDLGDNSFAATFSPDISNAITYWPKIAGDNSITVTIEEDLLHSLAAELLTYAKLYFGGEEFKYISKGETPC